MVDQVGALGLGGEGEHVGGRVEQVIAFADADRLQRWAQRTCGAEKKRRVDAVERIPASEDDKGDRHQALTGGEALVPAGRITQRQERAADAGKPAADHRAEQADALDRQAHGLRGIRTVADDAHLEARPGVAKYPGERQRKADAEKKQRAHIERAAHLRCIGPKPKRNGRQQRRARLHVGLTEEEGDAGAPEHNGNSHRNVVDPGKSAHCAVNCAERCAAEHGGKETEPRGAGFVRRGVGDHCAEHERALVAEIDASGFFGETFTDAHEQERRAHTQRAREQRDRNSAELVHHTAPRG